MNYYETSKQSRLPLTLFVYGAFVIGRASRKQELQKAGFTPTTPEAEAANKGRIIECRSK